ncbi:MAG: thioredoxin domain-containing protein [Candidatus Melainabacteria bacterium]|nr:thioredoxin domain-containing protein [Candidatus Melainabacteria bacterium]
MKSAIKKPNKLINEKSPYLLQHAYNPVDWYPWCDEAFEKAKNENKPIFLSIGYSTCHWCHVMEHESFEDDEVAKVMNENCISIKVDREERPDIDNVYMTVCQMMTGSGGWPLTVIMTPDKKPFFAGTYFPKNSKYGRIGMMDLIPRIYETWMTRKQEALDSAEQITMLLNKMSVDSSGEKLDESVMKTAYEQLLSRFDSECGGFGSAPKFPTPHNLNFLLRWWKRTHSGEALKMVEKTLQAMHCGGIYDHIGFGFHRYSTDSKWFVPHFEKMLYDQAMLGIAYIETYQATKNNFYADVAKEILTYVLRDMTAPDGGFYSAEDADSEGEEGKFYVWTYDEIKRSLKDDEIDLVVKTFNVEKDGNYLEEATREKTRANILYLKKPLSAVDELLDNIRQKLFEVRKKRIYPYKDDKILTSWNGLMIAALSKGAQALNEPKYADSAKRAADFILSKMFLDGRLLHSYRDGEAKINGHIDDYTFFIFGLLELYEATFEVKYLQVALDLNQILLEYFWDHKNGGFYFTAVDDENLIVRQKEIYDGAIPSGNSIAMLNLFRLGAITGNFSFKDKALKIGTAFSKNIMQAPIAHTQMLVALDYAIGPSYEAVIVGKADDKNTLSMLNSLRKEFIPNKILLFKPTKNSPPDIAKIAKFIESYKCVDEKTTAYICQNYNCSLPTTEISKMLELLLCR